MQLSKAHATRRATTQGAKDGRPQHRRLPVRCARLQSERILSKTVTDAYTGRSAAFSPAVAFDRKVVVFKLRNLVVLVSTLIGAWPALVWGNHDPLHLSFPENPPLAFSNGTGVPRGRFIDALNQRSGAAGLKLSYESRPAKRILAEVRADRAPICSLGWFKTPERETFAKFSRPIYRDRGVTIVSSLPASTYTGITSLQQLLGRGTWRIGAISGLSYGADVDRILAANATMVERPTVTVDQMLRIVSAGRVPLAVVAEEHLNWFLEHEGGDTKLVRLSLSDLPKTGPQRFIMCSRRTPDDLIKAIDALIGEGLVPGQI